MRIILTENERPITSISADNEDQELLALTQNFLLSTDNEAFGPIKVLEYPDRKEARLNTEQSKKLLAHLSEHNYELSRINPVVLH